MATAKSFYMLRNSFKVVGMNSLKCGQKSLQENVSLYVQNLSPKGATRAEWRFIGVLTGETLPVSRKGNSCNSKTHCPILPTFSGVMGIRPWTFEAPHGDDRKLSPTAPSRLSTSTSEAVWIHIRTWWCWRALVAGDSPWNRKQFEGFGKLEKSWNLAETCSVLKALRLYGSGHWILQNGSTFQLWNLAAYVMSQDVQNISWS